MDKGKQNAEKSSEKIEKKAVGKKRPSKDEETVGATGATANPGMLEKKKQRTVLTFFGSFNFVFF